jgi:hypothetical protein
MSLAYYARVCWNSRGWQRPTGEAAKLESDSYVSEYGFGHEEWLFNFDWLYKGYHYGFLQPVYRSIRKQRGETIDLLLWSIGPNGLRVQVGEIKHCEVLSDKQAADAFQYYRDMGWLEQMKKHVAEVKGKIEDWSANGFFNVRFRPKDAQQFGEPYTIAGLNDRIKKLTRYRLVLAMQVDINSQWKLRIRRGSDTLPDPKSYLRRGSGTIIIDPHHAHLQKELMLLLRHHFGEKVVREERCVDITIKQKTRTTLVEIKTHPAAKQAIREALGQIMEYAFYWQDPASSVQLDKLNLVIVAPGALDEAAEAYIEFLRSKLHLPIRYSQFVQGDPLPDAFLQGA